MREFVISKDAGSQPVALLKTELLQRYFSNISTNDFRIAFMHASECFLFGAINIFCFSFSHDFVFAVVATLLMLTSEYFFP